MCVHQKAHPVFDSVIIYQDSGDAWAALVQV